MKKIKLPKNKYGEYISQNKYLREPKYYKNNLWCMAAWDSFAAKGQAGGCGLCSVMHYNGHLRNKRTSRKTFTTDDHRDRYIKGKSTGNSEVSGKLCDECISKIEKIISYEFKTR